MKLKDAVAQIYEDQVYVGFELAKLASEKGYDAFCEGSWTHYLKTTEYYKKNSFDFEVGGVMHGRNSYHKPSNTEYYEVLAAPTQAMLATWLRNEHNLQVAPTSYGKDNWSYDIDKLSNSTLQIVSHHKRDLYKNYEILNF